MPLSMTWKKLVPSPEVSRTALIGETKSLGITISSDVIWRSGGWKILEHGSFHTRGHYKTKKKTMPPFRGNPHQKFTIHICIKFGFPPKKWVIFHDPELHIPPSSKKIHIPPNLEEIESFPEKKNMDNPKATILKCSSRLGWYLGTGPFGGIIKERRFTSTCHTLKPTQQEGFRSQNYLQDSTKARIICVFSHCTSSEHDYRMKYEYLEYIFQPSSQCLSESQKKYTSTKLSAGGMPVSFSGSDLGRQKKKPPSLRGSFQKNDDLYIYEQTFL